MTLFKALPWAVIAGVVLAPAPAPADTTTARCDVYPRGDDQATFSGACDFSQRQGFITITLADGTLYDLSPSPTQAATYTDAQGRPATREEGLGTEGSIYRLADVSIFVYWDGSTLSTQPRRGQGNVPCSFGRPGYDDVCAVSVLYGDPGNATFTLIDPQGTAYTLSYHGHGLHSTNPADEVQLQQIDGLYYLSINDEAFFQLDESIVTGRD